MSNETEIALESSTPDLRGYVDSIEMQRRLYKRTLLIVVISQIFGGAGLTAGVTVGAILAKDMLGADSYAGFPSALITLGAALTALIVGRLSQRFGRRPGLAIGFMAGGIGAIGVVIAAVVDHIPLLFASLLMYGAGTSTNLQARYAGTDLAMPNQRGTAISIALVSTTFGAVAGPNLVNVMGEFAALLGVPTLAGPFILAAAAFIFAGLILLAFLRPDPFVVAKAIAQAQKMELRNLADKNSTILASNNRGFMVGITVMVLTQIVMVAVMTMTPIHMLHQGFGLGEVGVVISIHIGAMYLPSLVTGVLVDKVGRTAMSIAAGFILLTSCLLAATVPTDSMFALVGILALLGLGWNFGLISGTALIVDSTPPATRAKTQGSVDVLIALAGASGGALSGLVVAHSSYATLSLAGAFLSLLLIPVVIWSQRNQKVYS